MMIRHSDDFRMSDASHILFAKTEPNQKLKNKLLTLLLRKRLQMTKIYLPGRVKGLEDKKAAGAAL